MSGLSRDQAAARAGVDAAYIDELIAAGVLAAAGSDGFSTSDVRRIGVLRSLQEAGLPLDGLAAGFAQGVVTLDFMNNPEYERFAGLSGETFDQVSARTGVPVALLGVIREAIGLGSANGHDLLREDELAVVPFLEMQLQVGFRPAAIERLLRGMGDSLRRVAESEAEWWRSEIIEPRIAAGLGPTEVGGGEIAEALTDKSQQALLAMLHAQQAQTWTTNIVAGFEGQLAKAGLFRAPDRPPAICFLDITGYTRLTQERGDRAAAELAEALSRITKRTSIDHGGRAVKWLGDGVMFWFRDPGPGTVGALEMVDALGSAGLPPAHVGLHAGPVVMQQGDYYGQTVNMAARIAEYARPGEVLVSQAVADAASAGQGTAGVRFLEIGPVELKGVSGAVELHAAKRAS
jgi:adenylate cyclase